TNRHARSDERGGQDLRAYIHQYSPFCFALVPATSEARRNDRQPAPWKSTMRAQLRSEFPRRRRDFTKTCELHLGGRLAEEIRATAAVPDIESFREEGDHDCAPSPSSLSSNPDRVTDTSGCHRVLPVCSLDDAARSEYQSHIHVNGNRAPVRH